jgi:hypothetical protein
MRIALAGDLHLRDTNPRCRTDDYCEVLFGKLDWCLDKAASSNCNCIIFPGDIFDTVRASDSLKARAIQVFRAYEQWLDILVIAGQHDTRYHTPDLGNTPINVLVASQCVRMLSPDKTYFTAQGDIAIVGANWGVETPPPPKATVCVLVVHQMVSDKDYWFGKTRYNNAEQFFRDNAGYDLIVCGDNHHQFVLQQQRRALVNMGSVGRAKSDQATHIPRIGIFDTENPKELELFEIPISPADNVISPVEDEWEVEISEDVLRYVSRLADAESDDVDYEYNVLEYLQTNKTRKGVREIIMETLE